MTTDQSTPVVFDSVVSIAIRLLRRYWTVAASIVALVTLAVLLLASRSSALEAQQTLFVNDIGAVAERAEAPTEVLDPRGVAIRLNSRPDFVEPTAGTAAVAVGDGTAQSLEITVVGTDEAQIVEALGVASAIAEAEISGTLVVQLDSALSAEQSGLEVLREDVTELNELIPTLSGVEQDAAILTRSTLTEEITLRATQLSALEAFAETAAADIVEIGPITSKQNEVGPTVIVGGIIAGSVAAGGLFGLWAASGRVRRRMHIERAAPGTNVLGVVGNPAPLNDTDRSVGRRLIAELRTSLDETGSNDPELWWLGLGRSWESSAINDLGVEGVTPAENPADVPAGAVVVVEVTEGSVSENQVASLRATLEGFGVSNLNWVLSGVPRRDLSWANVAAQLPTR